MQAWRGILLGIRELGARQRHLDGMTRPWALVRPRSSASAQPHGRLVLVTAGALACFTGGLAGQQQAGAAAVGSGSGSAAGSAASNLDRSLSQDPGALRLLDVHFGLLAAVGGSTVRDADLGDLQGGAHDPRKRGFTLQEAELGLHGAIGEHLEGRVYVITGIEPVDGETIVELEEAYLTYSGLSGEWELDAGAFYTDLGIINRQHPHQWRWLDQPIMNSRLFGGDGMRGPGVRANWRRGMDGGWLGVSAQNAGGETMPSFLANDEVFEERPIGGRFVGESEVRSAGDLVYALRAGWTWSGDAGTLALGGSAAFGPNATGPNATTAIYGVDMRWSAVADCEDDHGEDHAHAGLEVQGEWLWREYEAAAQSDDADPLNPVALPSRTLRDRGGYLQVLAPFAHDWRVGLRGELATGSGDSYDAATQSFGRQGDAFRADRVRLSPMLAWVPSWRYRLTLQYNYDEGDALDGAEHSVWLGGEVRFGTSAQHRH